MGDRELQGNVSSETCRDEAQGTERQNLAPPYPAHGVQSGDAGRYRQGWLHPEPGGGSALNHYPGPMRGSLARTVVPPILGAGPVGVGQHGVASPTRLSAYCPCGKDRPRKRGHLNGHAKSSLVSTPLRPLRHSTPLAVLLRDGHWRAWIATKGHQLNHAAHPRCFTTSRASGAPVPHWIATTHAPGHAGPSERPQILSGAGSIRWRTFHVLLL